MKHNRIFAALLAALLVISLLPASVFAVSVRFGLSWNGNTAVRISAENAEITSFSVTEGADAVDAVKTDASTVTVTVKPGRAADVKLKLTAAAAGGAGSVEKILEFPLGYTTFVFMEGTKIAVYEGTDRAYGLAGLSLDGQGAVFTPGDPEHPLTAYPAAENPSVLVYRNENGYALQVRIQKGGGTYVLRGDGEDMSVSVEGDAEADTRLLLCGLTLRSSVTAVISAGGSSAAAAARTVHVTSVGGKTNTLSDGARNNAALYGAAGDGTNVFAASAVIGGGDFSRLVLDGTGKLTLNCASVSGADAGETGSLTVDGPELIVNSAENGLRAGNVKIASGKLAVSARNGDGIRANPGAAAGCGAELTGGSVTVTAGGSGIHATGTLRISGGIFRITGGDGIDGEPADAENGAALKASGAGSLLSVAAGDFTLEAAGDAIRSGGDVVIENGFFGAGCGGTGVYAENTLTLGIAGSVSNGTPKLTVSGSKTGFAAGTVRFLCGTYAVTSSGDGVRADGIDLRNALLNVSAEGSGLASGTLDVTGGRSYVWSSANDGCAPVTAGSPRFCGGTVFAAGNGKRPQPSADSQGWLLEEFDPPVKKGSIVSVLYTEPGASETETIYNNFAPRPVSFVFYTAPGMNPAEGWRIKAEDTEYDCTAGKHRWDNGTVTEPPTCCAEGVRTYTCILCRATKTEPVPVCGHSYGSGYCIWCGAEDPDALWPQVFFEIADGAHVAAYYSQNPGSGSVDDPAWVTARNGVTGKKDLTGDGECNFTVAAENGYVIAGVSAAPEEEFGALLTPSGTGTGTYRITKITGNVQVTVVTEKTDTPCLHTNTVLRGAKSASCTEDGYTGDTVCLDCGKTVAYGETITAPGHDCVNHGAQAPTCTEAGWNAYQTCTRCSYTTFAEIPALNHSDANADGLCDRCGAKMPDPCAEYSDIDRGAWYHTAADYVILRGLMGSTRTDALTFEPATTVSRAMTASILYRMAGSPPAEYRGAFTDVPPGKWYSGAIEWCAQNGLAAGKGGGKFDPGGNVTRQELAVFMMKMAARLGKDTSGRAGIGIFADGASVPAWARDSVSWAVGAGLISGKSIGGRTLLAPADTASRAELAAIIMRFAQKYL